MQVGAISYQPYIYNTNAISSKSMNKISAISNNALDSKTDVSGLIKDNSSNETTNPIKRGQSLDFAGILDMQMQMSRMNATRVMKNPENAENLNPIEDSATQAVSQSNPAEKYLNAAINNGFEMVV